MRRELISRPSRNAVNLYQGDGRSRADIGGLSAGDARCNQNARPQKLRCPATDAKGASSHLHCNSRILRGPAELCTWHAITIAGAGRE